MNRSVTRMFGVLMAGTLLLAACGSDSKSSDTTTTKAKETTTTAKESTTTAAKGPTGTAAPNTGLTDGQTITVSVSGFKPNTQNVGVNECAADTPDADVGEGDCWLSGIALITIDAEGKGSTQFTVSQKPDTANPHECTGTTRCFLSIGELTADANAQRTGDVPLAFVGQD